MGANHQPPRCFLLGRGRDKISSILPLRPTLFPKLVAASSRQVLWGGCFFWGAGFFVEDGVVVSYFASFLRWVFLCIWISSVAQVEIGFPKWVSKVGLFVDECLFFEPLLSTNIMTWTEIKGALKNWIVFFSECCFWYILSGDCCLMIHQISWKHEDVPNVHFPLPVGLNLFRNLSRWNAYLLRCFFQDWI